MTRIGPAFAPSIEHGASHVSGITASLTAAAALKSECGWGRAPLQQRVGPAFARMARSGSTSCQRRRLRLPKACWRV